MTTCTRPTRNSIWRISTVELKRWRSISRCLGSNSPESLILACVINQRSSINVIGMQHFADHNDVIARFDDLCCYTFERGQCAADQRNSRRAGHQRHSAEAVVVLL